MSARSDAFRKQYFPKATLADWNDWHWQLRHRIQDPEFLGRVLDLSADEIEALGRSSTSLPLSVTPYYASLLDREDPAHSLRRAVVPDRREHLRHPSEAEDPLDEDRDSPVPGIVHRYPDRVLFLVTGFCSTYCRYCTRSRMVGDRQRNLHMGSIRQWERALDYIRATPAVRDVLLSGGDPLTLSNERLEWLLSSLRSIDHVEFVRIGTKVPVVLPQRINGLLTRMLRHYHPLWMSIHFTHPDELTPEVSCACNRLADAGIPLGSQTVLLAGINDRVDTMKRLMQGLLRMRVRPYYLYQCDPIPGSLHFRTPVSRGLEIVQGLRGHTTGYAVPSYVIDAPGGGGKIPLLPEYAVGRENGSLLLRNYRGDLYRYPEEAEAGSTSPDKGPDEFPACLCKEGIGP
ncbi:MAG TPA: KamA family radical SAM protein [Syntrophobacteraceae bacterium]|nr:KamA family radical SAM protein [Syntrophobacteraceae bacterium]